MAEIGWAMFSHQWMDHNALAKELSAQVGFPIGSRYRPIPRGGDWPDDKPCKAIVFDCEKSQKDAAFELLHGIYTPGQTEFTLNLRLCLMPMLDECCTGDSDLSFHKYVGRQKDFITKISDNRLKLCIRVKGLIHPRTLYATHKYKQPDGKKSTISTYDMITTVQSRKTPGRPLFNAVCEVEQEPGTLMFTCVTDNHSEAQGIAKQGVIAMLGSMYSQGTIRSAFTSISIEKAKYVTWDAEKFQVVSAADKAVTLFNDEDDKPDALIASYGFTDMCTAPIITAALPPNLQLRDPNQAYRNTEMGDDNTLSSVTTGTDVASIAETVETTEEVRLALEENLPAPIPSHIDMSFLTDQFQSLADTSILLSSILDQQRPRHDMLAALGTSNAKKPPKRKKTIIPTYLSFNDMTAAYIPLYSELYMEIQALRPDGDDSVTEIALAVASPGGDGK